MFLEQAFLLPLPKYQDPRRIPDLELTNEVQSKVELNYWCDRLERLAKNKSHWPKILCDLQELLPSSFILVSQYASTRNLQSLLHLAVLDDQMECISILSSEKGVLSRRNAFGLTPAELAQFLHKQKSLEVLSHNHSDNNFYSQPLVEFELNKEAPEIDIEYLSQPIFESAGLLDDVLMRTQKAKNEDLIPNDRIWMGVYFDHEIQRSAHPKVAISYINDQIGYGVFAREKIMPSSFVGEYTGLIQERKSKHIHESNYSVRYTSWYGRHRYVVDAEKMGNFTRFINHSDDPNLSLISVYWRGLPRMIFISLKEILEDSQLTFDYGQIFWKQAHPLVKQKI